MKLNLTAIGSFKDIQRIEAKIRFEWDSGVLSFYKEISPDAIITVASQNKLTASPQTQMEYWFNIINEQNHLIGMFSIIGDKILVLESDFGKRKK